MTLDWGRGGRGGTRLLERAAQRGCGAELTADSQLSQPSSTLSGSHRLPCGAQLGQCSCSEYFPPMRQKTVVSALGSRNETMYHLQIDGAGSDTVQSSVYSFIVSFLPSHNSLG